MSEKSSTGLGAFPGGAAIVTGGASGLGAATAARLADAGFEVTVLDLPAGIEKAQDAGTAHPDVRYAGVDVTDADAVHAAVQDVAGRAPLRIAVNCAGIAPSARVLGRSGPHDPRLFDTVVRVNLVGTFHVLLAAAEAMSRTEPVGPDSQRGIIINTSSVAAFEGQVGQAAYAASKGGVHALSITCARDLAGHGIRVNAIAPGIVWTPLMEGITEEFRNELERQVPFPPRFARPDEYADLVVALVENGYLNGQTIRLDGALRMPPR